MAIKLFDFGFVLKAITEGFNSAMTKASAQIEALNGAAKQMAPLREAAGTLAMVGGASLAMGGAVGYGLKTMVDAAAGVDSSMRHLDEVLDSGTAGLREHAQALKMAEEMSVKFNYAQTDIIDNLYKAKSFVAGGDWTAALATTTASLAIAKGNLGDAKEIGEQLAIVWNNFGNKAQAAAPQIQHFADMMAYTSRHGAFENVGQLQLGLSTAIGSIKSSGMSYADALATLQGFSEIGLSGTEAGSALIESLNAFGHGKLQKDMGVALKTFQNGSLDVIGTLVNLKKEVLGGVITLDQFQKATKALGVRGERVMALPIDDVVQFRKNLGDPNLVNGAALQGALTVLQSFNEQMGILGKKWEIFKEAGGNQLLAPLISVAHGFGTVLDKLAGFAKAYPMITKFVVVFAAIGAAIAIVAGGAIALVGGLALVGSFIGVGGALFAIITGIGVAIAGWTAGLLTFGPALARFVDKIKGFFSFLPEWMKTMGLHMIEALGQGMLSALGPLGYVMGKIGGLIMDHIPHSPAKVGPLRDLHRANIVGAIADTMKPGPMVAAIRRVAMVTAIAAPMMLGAGMPALAARGAGAAVMVNYSPNVTVNAAGGDEVATRRAVMRALKADRDELLKIIDGAMAKRSRTEFD